MLLMTGVILLALVLCLFISRGLNDCTFSALAFVSLSELPTCESAAARGARLLDGNFALLLWIDL